MSKCWIYLWKQPMWATKTQDIQFDRPELDYAASDKFLKRGVSVGDTIFLVNVHGGGLYLGGYLKIESIVEKPAASKLLEREESELWPAKDYAIAADHEICNFRPRLRVPDQVVDSLWLMDVKCGQSNPKRTRKGAIDPQTFRAIREMAHGEGEKLMALLRA